MKKTSRQGNGVLVVGKTSSGLFRPGSSQVTQVRSVVWWLGVVEGVDSLVYEFYLVASGP